MRVFGRQGLIVAIALILGIGQACACLSHADAGAAPHATAQPHDAHAGHGDHHGTSHDDTAAKDAPCDEGCPHCADSLAMAIQSEAGVYTVPAPVAAVLANDIGQSYPNPFFIPRHYLALNWLDPPGDTPVSLKTVMRD